MPTGRGFDLLGGLDIVGADELTDVYYMEIDGITAGTPVAIKSAWVDPPTKLTDPAVPPTGTGRGVAWDPTGQYLAVAHDSNPYLTVYRRSGDSLTKLTDPAVLPTGIGYGVAWDPTGQYLAVAHTTSPYLTVYRRDGDTLTKLTDPAVLPTDDGYGVAWDPTGQYLAVAHNSSPYLTVYKGLVWGERVAYATGNTLADLLNYIATGVIGVGIAAETGGFKERRKVLRIWRDE